MPPENPKNYGISPAVMSLGLGDQLIQQVQDATDARKKKMREVSKQQSTNFGPAAANLLDTGINMQTE